MMPPDLAAQTDARLRAAGVTRDDPALVFIRVGGTPSWPGGPMAGKWWQAGDRWIEDVYPMGPRDESRADWEARVQAKMAYWMTSLGVAEQTEYLPTIPLGPWLRWP